MYLTPNLYSNWWSTVLERGPSLQQLFSCSYQKQNYKAWEATNTFQGECRMKTADGHVFSQIVMRNQL